MRLRNLAICFMVLIILISFSSIRVFAEENDHVIDFNPSAYTMFITYTNNENIEEMITLRHDPIESTWEWGPRGGIIKDLGYPTNYDNNIRDFAVDEVQRISAIEQDYFLISNPETNQSFIMQFVSMDTINKEMIFTKYSDGSSIAISYVSSFSDWDGELFGHKIQVIDENKKLIRIDLNGNGFIASVGADGVGNYLDGYEFSYIIPKDYTSEERSYLYNGIQTVKLEQNNRWYGTNTGINLGSIGIISLKRTSGTENNLHLLLTGPEGSTSYTRTLSDGSTASYIWFIGSLGFNITCKDIDPTDLIIPECEVVLWDWSPDDGYQKLEDYGFLFSEFKEKQVEFSQWIYIPMKYDATRVSVHVGTVQAHENFPIEQVPGTLKYMGQSDEGVIVEYYLPAGGGSGVITYALEVEEPEEVEIEDIEEIIEELPLPKPISEDEIIEKPVVEYKCGYGCYHENSCVSHGTRIVRDTTPSYCSIGNEWEVQKPVDQTCQNNYECASNFCSSDGRCIDIEGELEETKNILERILNFLISLFRTDDL